MLRHSYSDFSDAKLTPNSEDRLTEGNGLVAIHLTGADFEFVNRVAMGAVSGSTASPQDLPFRLLKGLSAGEQLQMSVSVDTNSRPLGAYRLLLSQTNGKTQAVPITLHPPCPRISNLPLHANLGQPSQTIVLNGTGLERIESITSKGVSWDLAPVPAGVHGLAERRATVKLESGLSEGQLIAASMTVKDIHQTVNVPGALQVAPPRPKIVSVNVSFSQAGAVALRPGEIPAGSTVSFALHTENVGGRPSLEVTCLSSGDAKQTLTLEPGSESGPARLDYAGDGILFLSLDPGAVGHSGCGLTAAITTPEAGASDPAGLGRVIRLPEIDKFSLTGEALGDSLYAGTLTGRDLQMIEETGWNATKGYPAEGIPTPVPGSAQEQTLQIELPWPPPAPGAPVYIWLRGESQGRKTNATY